MPGKTEIEWAEAVWNPVTGCSDVSPGCANCYAKAASWIRAHNPNPNVTKAYEGVVRRDFGTTVRWTGRVNCIEERLPIPMKWRKSKRIFVNSMSDLFHKNVSDAFIDKVFAVMALCPQHVFMILTKRPERMREYMSDPGREVAVGAAAQAMLGDETWTMDVWPLRNVMLGVSAENQATWDARVPVLLDTPSESRFVSCEPLLGPIEIAETLKMYLPEWIIVGGESCNRRRNARPMHPYWARSIRDECSSTDVHFLFKQWGEWFPLGQCEFNWIPADFIKRGNIAALTEDGHRMDCDHSGIDDPAICAMVCVGKKAAGRLLDGVEHNEFPDIQTKETATL